jgi:hypothetical protein
VRDSTTLPALRAALSCLFQSVLAVGVFLGVLALFLLYTGLILSALRRNGIEQGTFLHFIIHLPLTLLPGMAAVTWLRKILAGRR